jgi:riboflavin kinase/FMN adenylyltransferase
LRPRTRSSTFRRARETSPVGGDWPRRCCCHAFRRALAGTSAEDFVVKILAGALGIGGAAIGFDFHFGRIVPARRLPLPNRAAAPDYAVDVAPPLEDEGRPVSSGAVRGAAGRVVEATELAGAPWFVSGEVIHGDKRGREFGSANLKLDPSCGLKHGIYAVA